MFLRRLCWNSGNVGVVLSTLPWPPDVRAAFPDKELNLNRREPLLLATGLLCHVAIDLIQGVNCHSIAETCIFGSHTFVPLSWMCKKQTAVSHS